MRGKPSTNQFVVNGKVHWWRMLGTNCHNKNTTEHEKNSTPEKGEILGLSSPLLQNPFNQFDPFWHRAKKINNHGYWSRGIYCYKLLTPNQSKWRALHLAMQIYKIKQSINPKFNLTRLVCYKSYRSIKPQNKYR